MQNVVGYCPPFSSVTVLLLCLFDTRDPNPYILYIHTLLYNTSLFVLPLLLFESLYDYMSPCIMLYKYISQHISTLHWYLLDISRQLACMKLGSRGKYQPVQYCWVHTSWLLGYLVHTCHLSIDIQQIYCSTQTGQHSRLQRSCCPVWVLQPIHV